jgi:hypothetical protein
MDRLIKPSSDLIPQTKIDPILLDVFAVFRVPRSAIEKKFGNCRVPTAGWFGSFLSCTAVERNKKIRAGPI